MVSVPVVVPGAADVVGAAAGDGLGQVEAGQRLGGLGGRVQAATAAAAAQQAEHQRAAGEAEQRKALARFCRHAFHREQDGEHHRPQPRDRHAEKKLIVR